MDLDRIADDLVPDEGARLLVPHADDEQAPVSIWCRHGTFELPAGVDDTLGLVGAFEAIDPCRVVAVREAYHPARLIERLVSAEDLGGVAGFLLANPPEECDCDPDLTIDDRYPSTSEVLVVRLEHEPWCERAGQPSHGTGGLPTGRA